MSLKFPFFPKPIKYSFGLSITLTLLCLAVTSARGFLRQYPGLRFDQAFFHSIFHLAPPLHRAPGHLSKSISAEYSVVVFPTICRSLRTITRHHPSSSVIIGHHPSSIVIHRSYISHIRSDMGPSGFCSSRSKGFSPPTPGGSQTGERAKQCRFSRDIVRAPPPVQGG